MALLPGGNHHRAFGQGFANGVGFAIARKILQARTGRPELFNSKIYTIVSDGDIMEGITNEAASIAGTLD